MNFEGEKLLKIAFFLSTPKKVTILGLNDLLIG
jgi:hypothetical protein